MNALNHLNLYQEIKLQLNIETVGSLSAEEIGNGFSRDEHQSFLHSRAAQHA